MARLQAEEIKEAEYLKGTRLGGPQYLTLNILRYLQRMTNVVVAA